MKCSTTGCGNLDEEVTEWNVIALFVKTFLNSYCYFGQCTYVNVSPTFYSIKINKMFSLLKFRYMSIVQDNFIPRVNGKIMIP